MELQELGQGWARYSPWAESSPPSHLIRPALPPADPDPGQGSIPLGMRGIFSVRGPTPSGGRASPRPCIKIYDVTPPCKNHCPPLSEAVACACDGGLCAGHRACQGKGQANSPDHTPRPRHWVRVAALEGANPRERRAANEGQPHDRGLRIGLPIAEPSHGAGGTQQDPPLGIQGSGQDLRCLSFPPLPGQSQRPVTEQEPHADQGWPLSRSRGGMKPWDHCSRPPAAQTSRQAAGQLKISWNGGRR